MILVDRVATKSMDSRGAGGNFSATAIWSEIVCKLVGDATSLRGKSLHGLESHNILLFSLIQVGIAKVITSSVLVITYIGGSGKSKVCR